MDGDWRIYFSGEQRGHLEPCGCTTPQIGGMPRLATFLAKNAQDKRAVVVSNGDLVDGMDQQSNLKLTVLSVYLKELRYAALNLGEKDLAYGINYLQTMQTNSVPILCGNLRDERGGRPFPATVVRDGLVIVGLLADVFNDTVSADCPGYSLEPQQNALDEVKASLKGKESVVLLFHGDKARAEAIAKANPWLAAVVYAHSGDSKSDPYFVGKTVMAHAGEQGKVIGELRVAATGEARAFATVLGPEFANDKKTEFIRDFYVQALKEGSYLENSPRKPRTGPAEFVGNAKCVNCHQKEADIWKRSGHAHAMKTLETVKHEVDPECVSCHSVGFAYEGGYVTKAKTPHLADVGCESCHGAGSEHVQDVHKPLKARGEKSCLPCHTIENSPKFRFDEYWKKIKH